MKVLVTGANGFLGSHVVRELIKSGYDVRAFLLEGTSEDTLGGLTYDVYRGNLLQTDDIDKALSGCDYVIHTAAITDLWPASNQQSWEINFEVVKHLIKAVKKHDIKRYIHVGTANSFGFGTKEQPGNEDSPYSCAQYGLDYMASKKAAQDLLLEEVQNDPHFPVVIINPTFMIGNNDTKPGTGEMILSVIHRKVPGYAQGGRCFAAVKDVAIGCVNALTMGNTGECYITGGTNLCYKEFFTMVANTAGVKPPRWPIPTWISVLFAKFLERKAKQKQKKPLLTTPMVKISCDGHYYSSQKAINELNYPQTNLKIALEEAITWYHEHGYIE